MYRNFVAKSPQMLDIISVVTKIAPTNSPVLIHGENGVGKSLVAEQIHLKSLRRNDLFVRVNCFSKSNQLLESEIFGDDSSNQKNEGSLKISSNGTIFFDEVGFLPLNLQKMLLSYIQDFEEAMAKGWNLITEKYGRMMESTAPKRYEEIKERFPILANEKKAIIEEIVKIQVTWMEEFAAVYPYMAGNSRVIHTSEDTMYSTSFETYLRGEMGTYSYKTLDLYGRFIVSYLQSGRNLTKDIMTNTALLYGYESLEKAEELLAAQA